VIIDSDAQAIIEKCLEEAGWMSAPLREHTAIKILIRLQDARQPDEVTT